MQDRSRPVSSSVSVIGWETRPVLILATGLGFATRPCKVLCGVFWGPLRSCAVIEVWNYNSTCAVLCGPLRCLVLPSTKRAQHWYQQKSLRCDFLSAACNQTTTFPLCTPTNPQKNITFTATGKHDTTFTNKTQPKQSKNTNSTRTSTSCVVRRTLNK